MWSVGEVTGWVMVMVEHWWSIYKFRRLLLEYKGACWYTVRLHPVDSHRCYLSLQTAQTVLLVVTVFTICWMPHHIIVMWAEFGTFPLTQTTYVFRLVSHCLSYGNSCVNPILYAFLSENFRKACRKVFTCYFLYPPPPTENVVRFRMENFSTTHSTTNIWRAKINDAQGAYPAVNEGKLCLSGSAGGRSHENKTARDWRIYSQENKRLIRNLQSLLDCFKFCVKIFQILFLSFELNIKKTFCDVLVFLSKILKLSYFYVFFCCCFFLKQKNFFRPLTQPEIFQFENVNCHHVILHTVYKRSIHKRLHSSYVHSFCLDWPRV